MGKQVLCFKDGLTKFQDAKNIPKGWVIDRSMPISEPMLSEGLDITGQPDAFKEGDVIGEQVEKPKKQKKMKVKEQPCPPELK